MAEIFQLVRRTADLDLSRFNLEPVSPWALHEYFAEYAREDGQATFGLEFNPAPKVSGISQPADLCARMTAQLTEWLIANGIQHQFSRDYALDDGKYYSSGTLTIFSPSDNVPLLSLAPLSSKVRFLGFNVTPAKAFNTSHQWGMMIDLAVAAAHHNNSSLIIDFDQVIFMYDISSKKWQQLSEQPVAADPELEARIEQGRIKAGRASAEIKGDTSFIDGEHPNG